MENKELNVNCVLINREYYNDEKKISGKNVYILDEYLKSNRCNLVITYGGYNETDIPDFCIKNIANLFDYDFTGKLALSIMDDDSITAQYWESRQKDVKLIYSVLEDDKSEKALDSFLYQRIYGNISKEYDENQYFQDDIISVSENEIFIDCGAYHGESIKFMYAENYIYAPAVTKAVEIITKKKCKVLYAKGEESLKGLNPPVAEEWCKTGGGTF